MTLYQSLKPFLSGDLQNWEGLPETSVAEFEESFGMAVEHTEAELGFYTAHRYVYPALMPSGGLVVYARQNRVILIETINPPPAVVISTLPEPCGIKANEILVPGAYAHEYIYCSKGLVLTVASPLEGSGPDEISRCRGIKPIATPDDFGPEYYKAFEDRVSW